jgi:hypothetical protein
MSAGTLWTANQVLDSAWNLNTAPGITSLQVAGTELMDDIGQLYTNAGRFVDNTGQIYFPGNGNVIIDSFGVYYASNGVKTFDSDGHIFGANYGTTTIAAGGGAGTSPTISVSGGDTNGSISLTTGTLPTGSNAIVFTLSYAHSYVTAPRSVHLFPANAATALLSGVTGVFISTSTAAHFIVECGSTGLTASTAYKWYYLVVG